MFSARSSKKDDLIILDLIILKGFCFNFFGISLFIHFSSQFYLSFYCCCSLWQTIIVCQGYRWTSMQFRDQFIIHIYILLLLYFLFWTASSLCHCSLHLSLTHSRILHLLSAVLLISFKKFYIFIFLQYFV